MAGPSIGGLLVQVLTAPIAVRADAVSFVASALFLRGVVSQAAAPDRAAPRRRRSAGIRFSSRCPYQCGRRARRDRHHQPFQLLPFGAARSVRGATLGVSPGRWAWCWDRSLWQWTAGTAGDRPLRSRLGLGGALVVHASWRWRLLLFLLVPLPAARTPAGAGDCSGSCRVRLSGLWSDGPRTSYWRRDPGSARPRPAALGAVSRRLHGRQLRRCGRWDRWQEVCWEAPPGCGRRCGWRRSAPSPARCGSLPSTDAFAARPARQALCGQPATTLKRGAHVPLWSRLIGAPPPITR